MTRGATRAMRLRWATDTPGGRLELWRRHFREFLSRRRLNRNLWLASRSRQFAHAGHAVGRISRYGIIPLTADQDTAGPMARTVADAATLLGVLENPQQDPGDPVKACQPPPNRDYTLS